jgi:hypothetical protein
MEVNTLYKDMMFSVLRLVTSDKNGDGTTGTGVLVDLELTAGETTPVLVTNKHVVEGATEISFHLPASGSPTAVVLGHTVQVQMKLAGDGFFSPRDTDVDIAVIPFGAVIRELMQQSPKPFVRYLAVSEFPSDEEYASLDALEEVFFMGFPNGRWDNVNRTPIIRRGITATPAPLKFDGKSAFLIDASVFPGSSGSPVFIARSTTFMSGQKLVTEQLAIFAGLVTESLHQYHPVTVFNATSEVSESLDLGVVTNVIAIKDALEQFCDYASMPKPKFRSSPLGISR